MKKATCPLFHLSPFYPTGLRLVRSLIVCAEGETEIFLLVVGDSDHHGLLAELFVPGSDFIRARRKLQFVRSILLGNGAERMIEHTDESAHPLVNVTTDRNHFRRGELRLVLHVFERLADVELG